MEDNKFLVYEYENIGEVQVTQEVVARIAAIAAMEVEGVDSLAGNITRELIARLSSKNLQTGVDVTVKEGALVIYLALVMNMGCNIQEASKQVQEKVKSSIEGMTGLKCGEINVKIANVKLEK